MELTPSGLVEFARSPTGKKLVRYSMVSVVGVAVTQLLIIILHAGLGVASVLTNVLAVGISAVPAYYLNRAWVWGKRGKSHLTKEVIPFWAFAFAGLVLSTLLVALIAGHTSPAQKESVWGTVRIMLGNIAGFGVLWVARFLVLDRLLFGSRSPLPADDLADDDIGALDQQ